ncbi:MAG TPA: amidohydrolase family protein, partial [Alicyclobacillus sp.]|nr:amidohydrolase family protein [Alicyclobacillus sp.]
TWCGAGSRKTRNRDRERRETEHEFVPITVAAHMLYPEIPKAFDWLERFPNLYLDGTGAVASADEDGLGETLYPLMERYADQVLYGSDYAMAIESVGASWKRFQEMPISDEAQKRIAWETPLELLKRRNWPFCGDLPARYRDAQSAPKKGDSPGHAVPETNNFHR